MGYWAVIYWHQNAPTLPRQTASEMAQNPLVNQQSDLKSDGLLMSKKQAPWFSSKNEVAALLVVLVQIICHCTGTETAIVITLQKFPNVPLPSKSLIRPLAEKKSQLWGAEKVHRPTNTAWSSAVSKTLPWQSINAIGRRGIVRQQLFFSHAIS